MTTTAFLSIDDISKPMIEQYYSCLGMTSIDCCIVFSEAEKEKQMSKMTPACCYYLGV